MQEKFRGGLLPRELELDVAGNSNVVLSDYQSMFRCLTLTGLLTGNITITYPVLAEDAGLIWYIDNETTGAFTITVKKSDSSGVVVPQGACIPLLWAGDDFELADSGLLTLDDAIADVSFTSTARGDIIRRGASAWNNLSAKDAGKILVGDGTDIASVAVSGDGTLDSSGVFAIAENLIRYAGMQLSAAQILALADTPVELVPAPAAGKYIEFLGATLLLDHAGTGFAEAADNLEIHYENEAGAAVTGVIEMTGFIDQTADTVLQVAPITPVARAATDIVAKALVLTNINDNFTDAGTTTSVLRVKTAFRIHTTGF
jgi:hypothetical protein